MNNEEKIQELLTEMRSEMAKMQDTLAEVDQRSVRTQVLLETEFSDKLQLLYDGQVLLQQTLAPKERVEVLEEEVITLKTTVKMISNRLSVLEKAQ